MIEKQFSFLTNCEDSDNKYSKKIEAPIYEPKHQKPYLIELCNDSKTKKLVEDIEKSNLPKEEKEFLKKAAQRHTVFNYEKIADYYAHSNEEVKKLMQDSALVIIDFERAIELGYVKLCEDIKNQYLTEYANEK